MTYSSISITCPCHNQVVESQAEVLEEHLSEIQEAIQEGGQTLEAVEELVRERPVVERG